MAHIVIGSIPYYVMAQTSYMLDLDRMLHSILPACKVLDLLVETTYRVYFSALKVAIHCNGVPLIISYTMIMSKMELLAHVLTQPSTEKFKYSFCCCLQIVWSQFPVDIAMLVKAIQTLVDDYKPSKVYFNKKTLHMNGPCNMP